jgi:hypothetical protein
MHTRDGDAAAFTPAVCGHIRRDRTRTLRAFGYSAGPFISRVRESLAHVGGSDLSGSRTSGILARICKRDKHYTQGHAGHRRDRSSAYFRPDCLSRPSRYQHSQENRAGPKPIRRHTAIINPVLAYHQDWLACESESELRQTIANQSMRGNR